MLRIERRPRERVPVILCLFVAGSQVYLDRALLMDPPSKTNMKREQLDPVAGPLIQNWRPTQDKSSGLLPELAHPTFGEVVELLASDDEVDEAVLNVASQLCCIGADIYENEVGSAHTVHTWLWLDNYWCMRGF